MNLQGNFRLAVFGFILMLMIGSCVTGVQYEEYYPLDLGATLSYSPLTGIAPEAGLTRRDPSDIIFVDGKYYVWYTKIIAGAPTYPEGYGGTIWFASSEDGINWTEEKEVIGAGAKGAFDSFGVLTPNIYYHPSTKMYYLYYTGIGGERNADWRFDDPAVWAGIGVVKSARVNGGKEEWIRCNGGEPVIAPQLGKTGVVDGWHVDDTVAFYKDNQVWLYYKGHSGKEQVVGTPYPYQTTPMMLVVSDNPEGDFKKVTATGKPFLLQAGHEVLVWEHEGKYRTLPMGHYRPYLDCDYHIHESTDGIHFEVISRHVENINQGNNTGLRAPGCYRWDLTNGPKPEKLWGVSMNSYSGHPGLVRWELEYTDLPNEETK